MCVAKQTPHLAGGSLCWWGLSPAPSTKLTEGLFNGLTEHTNIHTHLALIQGVTAAYKLLLNC